MAYQFRFDPANNLDGGANSTPGTDDAPADALLGVSGTYWDSSQVNFTPTATGQGGNTLFSYNSNASGRVANFRDASGFSGFSGQVNTPTINPDGSATFTNPSTNLGYGFAIIDNHDNAQNDAGTDNAAFSSFTIQVTAGASGIDELTRFRMSLDGGPVTIPEPTSAIFLSLGLLGALVRRNR